MVESFYKVEKEYKHYCLILNYLNVADQLNYRGEEYVQV